MVNVSHTCSPVANNVAHKAHLKPDLHRACGCSLQHGEQHDTSRPGGNCQVHLLSLTIPSSRKLCQLCGLVWT